MRPFLGDPALMPAQADITLSAEMYQEWLAIRASSPLFRLETAVDVQERVSFENTGPDQIRGLIAMNISDVVAW
jgi:pullulanase